MLNHIHHIPEWIDYLLFCGSSLLENFVQMFQSLISHFFQQLNNKRLYKTKLLLHFQILLSETLILLIENYWYEIYISNDTHSLMRH